MTEEKGDMVSSENLKTVAAWMLEQSQEVRVSVATRSAFRALPGIVGTGDAALDVAALSTLRAMLTAGVVVIASKPRVYKTLAASVAEAAYLPGSNSHQQIGISANRAACAALEAYALDSVDQTIHVAEISASVCFTASHKARAGRNARKAAWKEIEHDLRRRLELGASASGLFSQALWSESPPEGVTELINDLREAWTRNPHLWEFWQLWYEGILNGRPMNWTLQERVALIPNDIWEAGPEEVAVEIARIREELPDEVLNDTELDGSPDDEAGDESGARQSQGKFIFLSYARADRPAIERIRKFMIAQDLPVWWDGDIVSGGWRGEIAERLEAAAAVLTFWTATSTTSDAVCEEAARAQSAGKLLHARLDDATLPYGFSETQYQNLQDWDGTAIHDEMAKLLQAIADKLDTPNLEELDARLVGASPVAFEPRDGRLIVVDTPVGVPPEVENDADLSARMEGLFLRVDRVYLRVVSNRYNTPEELVLRLDEIADVGRLPRVNWYALCDSRDGLADFVDASFGWEAWPDALVGDLRRICKMVDDIQPLLQPKQAPPGTPEAKPPETEPNVTKISSEALATLAAQAEVILHGTEAQAVLDASAVDTFDRSLENLKAPAGVPGELPGQTERRFRRLRKGVRGLAMATGGLLAAIGGGVAVNLLTAPGAAQTLATRLQPIYEALLRLFF